MLFPESSYRSVDSQTLDGNVHQVDHVPNGPTNTAAITTMFPLRLRGGKLLVVVTRERRYDPSRLRVNDNDGKQRTVVKVKVKFSHARYRALGPELIPVQSARR